ncbi:uncharacterized protein [Dermacentor andersoni]|uniref:uncharacterized protein n=1 Tax=Dermacentor andersoni TaxID=34620 RepID=UPI003B3B1329
MITSIVRLAVDPWSRRQHPIRVPKVSWFTRHRKFTVLVFSIGGTCLLFSRAIYDMFTSFSEPETSREHQLDLGILMQQTFWRKEGERPRSLKEALIEQEMIREKQRKEKEQQAALAAQM